MPTETAQICSTVYQQLIGKRDENVYKPSYPHHPSTRWAGSYNENFQITIQFGIFLSIEYESRYKKQHGSYPILQYIKRNAPELPSGGDSLINFGAYKITPPALAMPDKYKSDDPVKSYRDYYINEKTHRKDGKIMMVYTEREPPKWLAERYVFEKVKNKTIMKDRK
jgi:hypothetical protein